MSSRTQALVGVDRTDVAHVLPGMAADVARFDIAPCGFPVEYLTLAADDWSDVPSGRRCPHCDAAERDA